MNVPIVSKKFDLFFILLPGIIACLFVVFANQWNLFPNSINSFWWLVLVVFLDVGHVWSTLFRTYLHKNASLEFKKEMLIIPILAWAIGVVVYGIGSSVFWTMMAYLALFHFIKQQIGILKIYLRNKNGFWLRDFDICVLYVFILTPVLHWHMNAKKFHWFVVDDFFSFKLPGAENIIWFFYFFIAVLFIVKEIAFRAQTNLYKTFHIISTALVWLVGIVLYNNDWSFTLTNIIHHAVPYLALIWITTLVGKYQAVCASVQKIFDKLWFKRLLFYLCFLFIVAAIEEFLWDSFLWHEHAALFGEFFRVDLNSEQLNLLIPLLAVPQITHYVLDGIIWRRERKIEGFVF